MSALFYLLLIIGVVSGAFKAEREFEVKQASVLNNGRSYSLVCHSFLFIFLKFFLIFRISEIGKLNGKDDPNRYTIQNELLSVGKKLLLLENGQPLYEIKHKIGHLYQK
jgi:hypothetical protein